MECLLDEALRRGNKIVCGFERALVLCVAGNSRLLVQVVCWGSFCKQIERKKTI